MNYVFILGHNPKLSTAEILAVLPQAKIIDQGSSFLILSFDAAGDDNQYFYRLINRLGGTIKIGEILGSQISRKVTVEKLKQIQKESKLNFGLSYYDCSKDNLGMEIKKELKASGVSCRLVTSRDKILSSVVVAKNQCAEFLVLGKKWLGLTLAIQNFEDYSTRDYGRPARDLLSGSMPPKLAKIMINLGQVPSAGKILDPFCGSGTVLQEGILMGYQMVGSDISEKAVRDSKENMEWLANKSNFNPPSGGQIPNFKSQNFNPTIPPLEKGRLGGVFQSDIKEISKKVSAVDAIITEPYLGPPLKGKEKLEQLRKIMAELSKLYLDAFAELRKVLNNQGKIVIVFPAFRIGKEILELPILPQIKKLGFTQLNKDKLIYSRPDQKLWRQVFVFQSSLRTPT